MSTKNIEIRDLKFTNIDATPKVVDIKCDTASIRKIMAWYGSYFNRDRYFVTVDGMRIEKDINGEPVNEVRAREEPDEEAITAMHLYYNDSRP